MKLYVAYLHLFVWLTRYGFQPRNKEYKIFRLVVCASSPDDAKERALAWFQRESVGPLKGPTFGSALWDAVKIELDVCSEIEIVEKDTDVLVLS